VNHIGSELDVESMLDSVWSCAAEIFVLRHGP
jgi:hypothetical protein